MISENILQFLYQLSQNNNRDWFHANKDLYNKAKKEFEIVIDLLMHEIGKFDKDIAVLLPKDCIFRIFRDIRFSNDKTPYKTNFGAYMSKGGRKLSYAGYYFHIEPPDEFFLAGGIYMPPSAVLRSIRNDIYINIDEFKEIINNTQFKKEFGSFREDKLAAAPRGFSKDFPDIELLKYKHYLVIKELTKDQITNKQFIEYAGSIFQKMYPLNRFLNTAIEEGE